MGLFNLFKRKTKAEKNAERAKKIRNRIIIHEKHSVMHQMIISLPHDASFKDENPEGEGPFGLIKSNPIPVHGIDNIPAYIGSNKPNDSVVASSTSSPNIKGPIDVYNLYSINGKMLAKIFVNSYSLKTSNKVPEGFFHRDEIPAVRDTKVLIELLKK